MYVLYYITLRLKLALCRLAQVSPVLIHDVQLDASEAQSGVDNVGGNVTAEDAAGHDNSEQPTRRSASRAERPTAEAARPRRTASAFHSSPLMPPFFTSLEGLAAAIVQHRVAFDVAPR